MTVSSGSAPASLANRPGLSVIVPAFNEAGNLEALVERALPWLVRTAAPFEILLVDDGSRDGTAEVADRLATIDARVRAFHHGENRGFGAALKTGFRNARGDWMVVIPADLQFDLADLSGLLDRRTDADIVCTYRIDRKDSLRRRMVSAAYRAWVGYALDLHYRDLNWVKLYRREALANVVIESDRFCIDVEVLAKAKRRGLRIVEVPVPHHPRVWGQPTAISFANVTRTLAEIRRLLRILAVPASDGDRR